MNSTRSATTHRDSLCSREHEPPPFALLRPQEVLV